MASKKEIFEALLENTAYELSTVDSSGKVIKHNFITHFSCLFLSDDEEEDRIFDELEENVAIFAGIRYTYRDTVPKNLNWFDDILQELDDKRFKMLLRCSRTQFNIILALIENNPVFHGENSEKQFSVAFQLALVLYRLGSNGHGATLCKIAQLFGVGDGGTIDKVTKRVFESILCLKNDFLFWPSPEEREQLVLRTFNELPHCILYGDGMETPLQDRPGLDHVSYFSRNRQYSIKTQGVCDYSLRIRQVTIGYPGSVHDARIYNNCRLSTHSKDYFSGEQYMAADSAYKLTTTVITPFRKNSTALTPAIRTKFNKYFSSFRVRIEHLFGILKERFASLYSLAIKVHDKASHKYACDWIHVCCILHNILIPHLDEEDWNNIAEFREQRGNNDNVAEGEDDYDDDLDGLAEAKRIALAELITEN